MSNRKLSNRKDWYFPQRVITRSEEQAQNNLIKGFIGNVLISPILILDFISTKLFSKKIANIITMGLFNSAIGIVFLIGFSIVGFWFYILFSFYSTLS